MKDSPAAGFTLVELMVTVAVLAILVAIGMPSFQYTIRSNRVATSVNELIASIAMVRSEAIRNTRGATLCGSVSGTACDGTFSNGVLAWADINLDGAITGDETVLRFMKGNAQISVTDLGTGVLSFDARGRRLGSADRKFEIKPGNCGGQPMKSTLTINSAGQVSTVKSQACS